jgi:site-specific DNA-methyltransferase (adenine-specific)
MYHKIKRLKQKQETLQYLHSPSSMEVYTPLSLVKQMLDTLPNDVWKNPNLTWCDPCCKSGSFLSEAILRLFDGLSDWEKNEEKRYNHIVNNMIFAHCESNISFSMSNYLNLKHIYNSIYDPSIRYDIIISNPNWSFSSKNTGKILDLYDSYIYSFLNGFNKYILSIIPARWKVKNSGGMKEFRHRFCNSNIKLIQDVNIMFSRSPIRGGINYFLIDKSYMDFPLVNGVSIDLKHINNEYGFIPNNFNRLDLLDKCNKYNSISSKLLTKSISGIKTNHKWKSSGIKCRISNKKGGWKFVNETDISYKFPLDSYKVIIPSIFGIGDEFYSDDDIEIIGPREVCNESYVFFSFNSYDDAEQFVNFLLIDEVKFLFKLKKIKPDVSRDTFSLIPDIYERMVHFSSTEFNRVLQG